MESPAIAASPGNFVGQPPIEHSPDSLSVSGPNNNVIRLPGLVLLPPVAAARASAGRPKAVMSNTLRLGSVEGST